MNNSNFSFDYEQKIWGSGKLTKDEQTFGGLRLKYCLETIKNERGKILEIGCGAGKMIRGIKQYRPYLEYYGCDISKTSLEEAKRYKDGIGYNFGDALSLPYKDNEFDIIVLFDVLEHLTAIDLAIKEISRVLKPGGTFHGFVPCEANPFSLYWLLWKVKIGHKLKEKYGGHIQRISAKELIKSLQKYGLNTYEIKYSYHLIGQMGDILDYVIRTFLVSNTFLKACLAKVKGVFFRLWEFISYWESTFLKNVIGGCIHISCVKRTN